MTFEVCYNVGDGIFSTNMLKGDEADCRKEAETHASRYNYSIVSFTKIPPYRVDENIMRGMPLTKVKKS